MRCGLLILVSLYRPGEGILADVPEQVMLLLGNRLSEIMSLRRRHMSDNFISLISPE